MGLRVLQAAQLHLRLQEAVLLPGCRWGPRPGVGQQVGLRVPEGHERAHQSELGFEQQNRFRHLQEIQRIERKAFRARADAAQSARQGGTEPGTTRFRDGRATAEPRPKRARPRKCANLARRKSCDFGPEI